MWVTEHPEHDQRLSIKAGILQTVLFFSPSPSIANVVKNIIKSSKVPGYHKKGQEN